LTVPIANGDSIHFEVNLRREEVSEWFCAQISSTSMSTWKMRPHCEDTTSHMISYRIKGMDQARERSSPWFSYFCFAFEDVSLVRLASLIPLSLDTVLRSSLLVSSLLLRSFDIFLHHHQFLFRNFWSLSNIHQSLHPSFLLFSLPVLLLLLFFLLTTTLLT